MNLKLIKVDNKNKKLLEKITLKADQNNLVDEPIEAYEEAKKYKYSFPMLVLNGNDVIAFFIYESLNENFTEFLIWGFLVSSQYQGQGYGKKIMQQLIQNLKNDHNLKRIELAYVPNNSVAKNLYRKLGFKENGKINNDGEIEMEMKIE